MHRIFKSRKDKIIAVLLNGFFFLAAFVCALCAHRLSNLPDSQYAAERWQGEGTLKFAQISCFLPADEKLQISDINGFRTKVAGALSEASIDLSAGIPFIDCWSCEGSAKVYGAYSGTADLIACGGDFFTFHPLKLVSGNYFSGDDLMQDNVLLDEDLAWLLFGGNDLEGQFVYIYNTPFRVAGVVAREGDQATEKAYQGGMGLFMSYQTYYDLNVGSASGMSEDGTDPDSVSNVGITCYEVCLPDPVKGFARSLVEEHFPLDRGETVVNTGRFHLKNILSVLRDFSLRSMHSGVEYSYWENAARYTESKVAILLLAAALLCLLPFLMAVTVIVLNLMWTNRKLRDVLVPKLAESTEERVRQIQRKQWERKHPNVK